MSRVALCILMATVALLPACQKPTPEYAAWQPVEKEYSRPLPPGQLALRKIDPAQYPDFRPGFHRTPALRDAVRHSLAYLGKDSSRRYFPYLDITRARAVASLERFLALLETSPSAEVFDAAIRREFDVYTSVGCDNEGTVFFTGYYTPIFEGRRERSGEFRYPLYSLPPDLVKDEEGQTLGQRLPSGEFDPTYPTRRQIEEGRLLDGLEIAWLSDPFEAYVVTVQGSAKLRLSDGTMLELGYAGNNGREYTPIAAAMIADGVIGRDELSLQKLLTYFERHPDEVYHYAWKNDRYVFFQEAPGGPFGSLNTPVTPMYSVATDKAVFPRACITFLTCDLPQRYGTQVVERAYAGFALDQDTGGAIRAAGRCDVYMGIGPSAEALAGRTGSEGRLYYIFLRERDRVAGPDSP